jgi:cytidylate kinase
VITGSFSRAVTAEMLRRGVDSGNLPAVKEELGRMRFGTLISGRSAHMEINSHPVDLADIRSPAVNAKVSGFAAMPEVRDALLAYQRGQADVARQKGFRGLVMEGRDIGSVIFPGADFRFFLHADPAERARRRAKEGQTDSIADRDRMDSQRKAAPLACPQGAIPIDSTLLGLQEVVDLLSTQISRALSRS